ncbi:hypothetical protein AeMF1_005223 [Aphanomyces euteiches]|nr:hypothetical protein AeMF1_005223 [Aphanomyces euteiches]KAH9182611.1 hypothetical protein AeNC1_015413 [Aphanomyces euteiches]
MTQRVLWTTDAPKVYGQSSMDILLEWISEEGNYDSYRGGLGQCGKTKEVLCGEVERMASKGIHHRNASDVRTKINELERSYRKTCDWMNQTGQGILESNAPDTHSQISTYVRVLCKYYDILQPILADRPSTTPLATSEERAHADEDKPSKKPKRNSDIVKAWSKSSKMFIARQDIDNKKLALDKERLRMERSRDALQVQLDNAQLISLRAQAVVAKYRARRDLIDLGLSGDELEMTMREIDLVLKYHDI